MSEDHSLQDTCFDLFGGMLKFIASGFLRETQMNIPNVNAVQQQTQMAESMVSRNAVLAEESIRSVHSAFVMLALSGLLLLTTLHHHAQSIVSRGLSESSGLLWCWQYRFPDNKRHTFN